MIISSAVKYIGTLRPTTVPVTSPTIMLTACDIICTKTNQTAQISLPFFIYTRKSTRLRQVSDWIGLKSFWLDRRTYARTYVVKRQGSDFELSRFGSTDFCRRL